MTLSLEDFSTALSGKGMSSFTGAEKELLQKLANIPAKVLADTEHLPGSRDWIQIVRLAFEIGRGLNDLTSSGRAN
jgi:hypothetical protein